MNVHESTKDQNLQSYGLRQCSIDKDILKNCYYYFDIFSGIFIKTKLKETKNDKLVSIYKCHQLLNDENSREREAHIYVE